MPRRKTSPPENEPPPLPAPDDPSCPPRYINGRVNPAHFAWRIAAVNAAAERRVIEGDETRFNPEPYVRNIYREAELCGVTPEMISDQRSDAQIASDLLNRIMSMPASIWEALDAELDAKERFLRQAIENTVAAAAERLHNEGKRWLSLLERVRRLRNLAREPAPRDPELLWMHSSPVHLFALKASHIMRFMVYTMSVGGVSPDAPPMERTMSAPIHLCRVALDTAIAENRTWFDAHMRLIENTVPVNGIMVVIPPGHGKTTISVARARLRICQKPWRRWIIVHAQEREAQKILSYIRDGFDPSTPDGRRTRALFPHVRLARKGNTASEMRLILDKSQKQPTIQAYGVHAEASGPDADELLLDDVVDQSVAYSTTECARIFDRINGTWMARVRPKPGNVEPPFHFIACTLWHPNDPNAQRLELARRNKAPTYWSVQGCGGPDDEPPFDPLWPEVMPAHRLRQKFMEMRNPALYALVYSCDPFAEITRKISALSYYDPHSEEHAAFLERNPVFHLSIDPAATTGRHSDKSGIVYAAEGVAEYDEIDENGQPVRVMRQELRILEAREISATQVELVNTIADIIADTRYPVHHVHVEAAGGLWATPQMLQDRFMIEPIVHRPSGRSKETRLQSCAGYIDAGVRRCRPSVRFPGLAGGEPDENYRWLYDQFLLFPSSSDHCLDAVTQLVNYLASAGRLPPQGTAIQSVVAAGMAAENERRNILRLLMGRSGADRQGMPAEVSDWEFASEMAS